MTALTGPRDVRDARRLAELETVIDGGLQSFVAVGEALLEVRDSRLYRIGYETFEAYCKGRWSFTDRRARQLMDATEAVRSLPTGTMVPVTERQARELAPVIRDHGPEVAAQVMAEASANGPATAETVRAAAAPFRPRLAADDPYFGDRQPDPEVAAFRERTLAADPDVQLADIRLRWSKALLRLSELVSFEPGKYVRHMERGDLDLLPGHIASARAWLDAIEREHTAAIRPRLVGDAS
jgi:hypothetical protein